MSQWEARDAWLTWQWAFTRAGGASQREEDWATSPELATEYLARGRLAAANQAHFDAAETGSSAIDRGLGELAAAGIAMVRRDVKKLIAQLDIVHAEMRERTNGVLLDRATNEGVALAAAGAGVDVVYRRATRVAEHWGLSGERMRLVEAAVVGAWAREQKRLTQRLEAQTMQAVDELEQTKAEELAPEQQQRPSDATPELRPPAPASAP